MGGGDADDLADTGGHGGAYAGRGVLGRERGRGVDAEAFAGQPVAGGIRLAVDHVGEVTTRSIRSVAASGPSIARVVQAGPAEVTTATGTPSRWAAAISSVAPGRGKGGPLSATSAVTSAASAS